jgi:hypothetical protein
MHIIVVVGEFDGICGIGTFMAPVDNGGMAIGSTYATGITGVIATRVGGIFPAIAGKARVARLVKLNAYLRKL